MEPSNYSRAWTDYKTLPRITAPIVFLSRQRAEGIVEIEAQREL